MENSLILANHMFMRTYVSCTSQYTKHSCTVYLEMAINTSEFRKNKNLCIFWTTEATMPSFFSLMCMLLQSHPPDLYSFLLSLLKYIK